MGESTVYCVKQQRLDNYNINNILQTKKTKLNNGEPACPKKCRAILFSLIQGCPPKNSGVLAKKKVTLQQSISLYEVEWSKPIKILLEVFEIREL